MYRPAGGPGKVDCGRPTPLDRIGRCRAGRRADRLRLEPVGGLSRGGAGTRRVAAPGPGTSAVERAPRGRRYCDVRLGGGAAGGAGGGYYSYTVGGWQIVSFTRNGSPIGGGDRGSGGARSLRADLAA